MEVAKFKIDLSWKDFSVDLNAVGDWLKANAGESYCGTQAYSILEVWFTEEPDQNVKDAVALYWDELSPDSPEASSYKSQSDRNAEIEAKRDSAKAKLKALGLSDDELAALMR